MSDASLCVVCKARPSDGYPVAECEVCGVTWDACELCVHTNAVDKASGLGASLKAAHKCHEASRAAEPVLVHCEAATERVRGSASLYACAVCGARFTLLRASC